MQLSQNGGDVVTSWDTVLPGFVSVVIFQSACLEGYKEYCYKNLVVKA